MKRLIMLGAVLLAAAVPVNAQEDHPTSEIFAGYSYLSSDIGLDRDGLHGWGLSFSFNPSPRWGLTSEFSGHYGSTRLGGSDLDLSRTTFLFGPRASARGKAASAFGHVLLGGATAKLEGTALGTKFAVAVGGGVDVRISKGLAFRLLQADYMPIRGNGEWLNNFRLQSGLVFRFGG